MIGNAGNNVIIGGLERDELTGTASADRFKYLSLSDSDGSTGYIDEIVDFSKSQGDRIDLSAIDANENLKGILHFTYAGIQSSFRQTAQIIARQSEDGYYLSFNTDADSGYEMELKVVSGIAPDAHWFA